MATIPSHWANLLSNSGKLEIFNAISVIDRNLDKLSTQSMILPVADHRYQALSINPENVKCVIVGQDQQTLYRYQYNCYNVYIFFRIRPMGQANFWVGFSKKEL